jgi:hypothetical protein
MFSSELIDLWIAKFQILKPQTKCVGLHTRCEMQITCGSYYEHQEGVSLKLWQLFYSLMVHLIIVSIAQAVQHQNYHTKTQQTYSESRWYIEAYDCWKCDKIQMFGED